MARITTAEQQALDAHYQRCGWDYSYFCQHNHMVQNKKNELVYFKLNEAQVILEEIWADIEKAGRRIRLFCLKGRKQGISTWFESRGHWMIVGKGKYRKNDKGGVDYLGPTKNTNMSIIAHDPPTTETLFGICKRLEENLHPEFVFPKAKNNEHIILYKDDKDPKNPASLDSSIVVGTANTQDFGSGMTLTISHRSELAKWPAENVKSLLLSLDNALPDHKNTAVLNESTAKGVGGEFHHGFVGCRYIYEVFQDKNQVAGWKMEINTDVNENNEYSRIFIPWFVTKEYARPPLADFKLTLEEKGWKEKYNLSDEQIQWYRWCLYNNCSGDKSLRAQEFPNCWQEAFISSGEPAFDTETILRLKDLCEPPIARYDCLISNGQFISKADGAFKVWKEPDLKSNYVISADVSEGLAHGDFHSADVLEHDTGEQVAHYHGKMEPWEFASLLIAIGKRYNEAWLVPEKNNHGQQVIQELLKADYPNIYMEMIEEPPAKPRKRFGWVTTGSGDRKKQALIDNGKKIISEGNPGINDPLTYEEMLNFKRQADGKERADNGTFDDAVMSWLIGQYTRETLPYATRTRKVTHGPGGKSKTGKGKKSPDKLAYY
jgi:hypothetical protein